jgi:DNA invertase Pin-like site-specific DNA recombinase
MEYALGRQMEISDRPEIDRILEKVEKEKLGVRDLVLAVALSELFTKP